MGNRIDVYRLLGEYGYTIGEIEKIINDKSAFDYDKSKIGLMIHRSYKYLVAKGYSLEDIKKMSLIYPGNLYVSDMKRQAIEKVFFGIGMRLDEFRCFSLKCANIYACSVERINGYVSFFRNLGYDNKTIVKIFMISPLIFRSSVNKLNKLYNDMIKYTFSKSDVIQIGRSFPSFWSHSFAKVQEITDIFIEFGIDKNKIVGMIKMNPSILGYSVDTIRTKYYRLLCLGIEKNDLNNIILVYPSIINADTDRIEKIMDFFIGLGLANMIVEDPKRIFIQSIESSYARYCYYKDLGIEISEKNYKKLFMGWQEFYKTTGISKEELLEKYKYSDDVKKRIRIVS